MSLLALEVNPEILNKIHAKCGVSSSLKHKDVLGFEAETLKVFTSPVHAVFLALPLSPKYEEFRKKQAEETKDKESDPKVYFMVQKLENSSGLTGIIHTVANNLDQFSFGADSSLKEFIDKTANASPEERAEVLAKCEALLSDHNAVAAEGQCRPDGDRHFHVIVFTTVNGRLCELDGLTKQPIDHGATSEKTFLEDVAKICKQYTELDKDEVRFSAVALTKDA